MWLCAQYKRYLDKVPLDDGMSSVLGSGGGDRHQSGDSKVIAIQAGAAGGGGSGPGTTAGAAGGSRLGGPLGSNSGGSGGGSGGAFGSSSSQLSPSNGKLLRYALTNHNSSSPHNRQRSMLSGGGGLGGSPTHGQLAGAQGADNETSQRPRAMASFLGGHTGSLRVPRAAFAVEQSASAQPMSMQPISSRDKSASPPERSLAAPAPPLPGQQQQTALLPRSGSNGGAAVEMSVSPPAVPLQDSKNGKTS